MPVTIRTGALNYKDPTTGEYVGINAVEDGSFSTIAPSYSTLTFPVAAGQLCYQNGSLFKAKDAIATSETWTPAHWDEVTIAEELASKSSSGSVDDVQINGTSIVNNGVANLPIASANNVGVVKKGSGIAIDANGTIYVDNASSAQIKSGTASNISITPIRQHESAFYGLAKAAGDITQSASSNNVGTYTDDAKAAIQTMLGVPGDVQVNGTSVVSNGVANIPIASTSTPGVMRIASGLYVLDGGVGVNTATNSDVKLGTAGAFAGVNKQHTAVFYGLAKAAGADMKDSSNAVGTYTPEAKAAIKSMLGITDVEVVRLA